MSKDMETSDRTWDIFISYSSTDRENFVLPLVDALRRLALSVWWDQFEITDEENFQDPIYEGLSLSQYGVVVLTQRYFQREWPLIELRKLIGLEHEHSNNTPIPPQRVFPVLHGITPEDIPLQAKFLTDRRYFVSADGVDTIASELHSIIPHTSKVTITAYDGNTTLLITPDWGTVLIENIPPKSSNGSMKMFDFSGREVDFGKEFVRFGVDMAKTLVFDYSERIAIVQISEPGPMPTEAIESGILQVDIDDGDPFPFEPVFITEHFVIGISNKTVFEATGTLQNAAPSAIQPNVEPENSSMGKWSKMLNNKSVYNDAEKTYCPHLSERKSIAQCCDCGNEICEDCLRVKNDGAFMMFCCVKCLPSGDKPDQVILQSLREASE